MNPMAAPRSPVTPRAAPVSVPEGSFVAPGASALLDAVPSAAPVLVSELVVDVVLELPVEVLVDAELDRDVLEVWLLVEAAVFVAELLSGLPVSQ